MNERIKELALQASDSIPDDVSAEHAIYLFQKKFAESIVRECASMADFADKNPGDYVLKHFGVEE